MDGLEYLEVPANIAVPAVTLVISSLPFLCDSKVSVVLATMYVLAYTIEPVRSVLLPGSK